VLHNTTPDLQDQVQDHGVQDQDRSVQDQDQDRFFWSQTGLVLKPTVSDHITADDTDDRSTHAEDHTRMALVTYYWRYKEQ